MPNLPPFYVITVNYHSGEFLPDLISSCAALPFLKKLIIVNHSPQESLAALMAPFTVSWGAYSPPAASMAIFTCFPR